MKPTSKGYTKGLAVVVCTGMKEGKDGQVIYSDDSLRIQIWYNDIHAYELAVKHDDPDFMEVVEDRVNKIEALLESKLPSASMDAQLMAIDGMRRVRDDFIWKKVQ